MINYLERHKQVDKEIRQVSKKIFSKSKVKPYVICAKIAADKGITPQTVHNYAMGKGKDGFLKVQILYELRLL